MLWFLNHRNSLFLPELVFSFYANQKTGEFTVAIANKISIFKKGFVKPKLKQYYKMRFENFLRTLRS